VLAWQFGKIGGWYILVGLSYYIFAVTTWIRQKKRLKTYPLSESKHRRVLAGMQMGFLAVCLWPIFTPPATSLAAIVFGVPLLVTFFRDFLVMAGKINPERSLYKDLYSVGEKLFLQGLLPVLRVLLFIFFCYYVLWDTTFYNNFSHFMSKILLPEFMKHSQFIELSMVLSVGAITAGLLARIAALYLLLLTAIVLSAGFTGLLPVIALIISALIVIYGAGKYNIWNPEDAILQRKDGEQEPEYKEMHH
jgi:CDP-diacylglycerol--glycerol-3-phosphate 3-phosphatidyltransferase